MDLDLMTRPTSFGSEQEIFDAQNAWPDAPPHFYMQVNRMVGSVYQMACDVADSDRLTYWFRWLKSDSTWSDWTEMEAPPPPVEPPTGRRSDVRG